MLHSEREQVAAAARRLAAAGLVSGTKGNLYAAVLGCATAAPVAQGLGSDAGDLDLEEVEAFAAR